MKTVRLPESRRGVASARGFAPQTILVPLDFSPLSETAMQRAQEIATEFGSKLILLHALEPVVSPIEYGIIPTELEETNTQLEAERKTRLQAVQDHLVEEGLDCKAEMQLGKPWIVITDIAKRENCDLIVIGTHGLTGPKHWILGSTAERVVQHAPCSVLVVR